MVWRDSAICLCSGQEVSKKAGLFQMYHMQLKGGWNCGREISEILQSLASPSLSLFWAGSRAKKPFSLVSWILFSFWTLVQYFGILFI